MFRIDGLDHAGMQNGATAENGKSCTVDGLERRSWLATAHARKIGSRRIGELQPLQRFDWRSLAEWLDR